jgi:hypothetical protein
LEKKIATDFALLDQWQNFAEFSHSLDSEPTFIVSDRMSRIDGGRAKTRR